LSKNRIIPYKPYLKELARELRKNSTIAEILLWEQLKQRKLGFQFHRQVPMDNYIVDFYCHELMLAIEVDGSSHDNEKAIELDFIRQNRLEKFGVKFLRFEDINIKNNVENVVKYIEDYIREME